MQSSPDRSTAFVMAKRGGMLLSVETCVLAHVPSLRTGATPACVPGGVAPASLSRSMPLTLIAAVVAGCVGGALTAWVLSWPGEQERHALHRVLLQLQDEVSTFRRPRLRVVRPRETLPAKARKPRSVQAKGGTIRA